MIIIEWIFSALVLTLIIRCVYEVVSDRVRRARINKKYANLPVKVLLMDVLKDPAYIDLYYNMRLIMPHDRVAKHMVKRMLTDRKILKYRKESL